MSHDPRVLLQKADKALSSAGGGWSLFGGRQEKYENAIDLYKEAGNAFRAQDMDKEAGMAYEKAASIEENKPIEEPLDAANTLQDAFKAYGKSSPEDAARVLNKAINFYLLKNPRRAATQLQALAKHYEELMGDERQAMEAYQKAAKLFEKDNAQALANKNWQKVGELGALAADYQNAIDAFIRVASDPNGPYPGHYTQGFFNAILCMFAEMDLPGVRNALEKYQDPNKYPHFVGSNEYKFLSYMYDILSTPTQDQAKQFHGLVDGAQGRGSKETRSQFAIMLAPFNDWRQIMITRVYRKIPESGSVPGVDASAADDLEDDFS
ncbi:vesicular-fusion protein sec17 [Penicillium cosmopolitanum]|uniref:Vesicular-fusion protein sec17 n=1 Tax=Penicillium cosmopolitanum TaxID=1131564 RepID=A0A9X0B493_9EURO|nr:vesicular-fusion protein sec17 [Penicillium cosmopolitanum]KAJ5387547.1 vesicular-fusion protein sec17 [Penicillium cosmopolitanum]